MLGGAHKWRGRHDHGGGAAEYGSDKTDARDLRARLENARARLRPLAELPAERLVGVPPASEMRFADGQRTLEQIVVGLLNHQRRQCDALAAALAGSGRAA